MEQGKEKMDKEEGVAKYTKDMKLPLPKSPDIPLKPTPKPKKPKVNSIGLTPEVMLSNKSGLINNTDSKLNLRI